MNGFPNADDMAVKMHRETACGKEWRMYLLAAVAGLLTVLQIVLAFYVYSWPGVPALRYIGWAIVAVAFVLALVRPSALRRDLRASDVAGFVRSSTLVDRGIYAVVRHPQTGLGWMLMVLGPILIAQHWLVMVVGAAAMLFVYAATVEEDQHLIEKFGDEYRSYMRSVPSVNFLAGVIRLILRKRRR